MCTVTWVFRCGYWMMYDDPSPCALLNACSQTCKVRLWNLTNIHDSFIVRTLLSCTTWLDTVNLLALSSLAGQCNRRRCSSQTTIRDARRSEVECLACAKSWLTRGQIHGISTAYYTCRQKVTKIIDCTHVFGS